MFCIQCAPVFVRIVWLCEATFKLCFSVGSSEEHSMSVPSLYNIPRVFRGDLNIHGVVHNCTLVTGILCSLHYERFEAHYYFTQKLLKDFC